MNNLKICKPIAVVDCNFIQRCRGEADDVPRSWDCLLIASLFNELATKDERERAFLFSKFTDWTRRNSDRLWVAKDFGSLRQTMESSPEHVRKIGLKHLVCLRLTRQIRLMTRDQTLSWNAPLGNAEVEHWLEHGRRGRSAFVTFTDEARDFVHSLNGRISEKIPTTPQDIRNFVQSYEAAKLIIHRDKYSHYGDWRWRRHLEGFPDRLLIARTARLDLYYATRRALGDSRKFENNWDDAHYALAASYTGHLATHDRGLAVAAEIIAPGLRVFPREKQPDKLESPRDQ